MSLIYRERGEQSHFEKSRENEADGHLTFLEVLDGVRNPLGPKSESHSHYPSTSPLSSIVAKNPSNTDALFPPLPAYGPPSLFRGLQIVAYRVSSGILSVSFLMIVVAGSLASTAASVIKRKKPRPFQAREDKAKAERRKHGSARLTCDVRYYARRVGLDVEEFKVTTEDGFVLVMEHIFDPKDHRKGKKYPVLLVHGLLQSSGAFCSHDDNSLAFYLCKRLVLCAINNK